MSGVFPVSVLFSDDEYEPPTDEAPELIEVDEPHLSLVLPSPYADEDDDDQDDEPPTPGRLRIPYPMAPSVQTRARDYSRWGTWWGVGQCLKFSRTCAGAQGGVYDAKAAWARAQHKHTGSPPAGFPVWWRGGRHWHVGISDGGGWCWSTDIYRRGRVDRVPIATITRAWGYPYQGWAEDINSVRIAHPAAVKKQWLLDVSSVRTAARTGGRHPYGKHIKGWVRAEFKAHGKRPWPMSRSAVLGSGFRQNIKQIQVWRGVTPHHGLPGIKLLTYLVKKHAVSTWRVVP